MGLLDDVFSISGLVSFSLILPFKSFASFEDDFMLRLITASEGDEIEIPEGEFHFSGSFAYGR